MKGVCQGPSVPQPARAHGARREATSAGSVAVHELRGSGLRGSPVSATCSSRAWRRWLMPLARPSCVTWAANVQLTGLVPD